MTDAARDARLREKSMSQAFTGAGGSGLDSVLSSAPKPDAMMPVRDERPSFFQFHRTGYPSPAATAVKTLSRKKELAIALSLARFRSHLALPAEARGMLHPLTKHYDQHAEAFARLTKEEQHAIAPHLAPDWRSCIEALARVDSSHAA
jgi:hypothetical protein